jgi:hypothetical protein
LIFVEFIGGGSGRVGKARTSERVESAGRSRESFSLFPFGAFRQSAAAKISDVFREIYLKNGEESVILYVAGTLARRVLALFDGSRRRVLRFWREFAKFAGFA